MTSSPNCSLRATLAENLRLLRKARQYSQEELADRCGLHRTYIGSVERQERNVSLSTLEALAVSLEVSVVELLTPRKDHDGKASN
ncbi:helix-turn-helix domain-containing protein [Yanghanlia caeni]|uniref:Helix-turn-helix transcriptional regulator n=1 Tax=Yanghanlia caeni TaxID=3064283 RepID=A0ABU1D9U0_9BURK|nr:helix-turn-helix transcriptional regulator [Alcaligenaceae bacterium LG-2]